MYVVDMQKIEVTGLHHIQLAIPQGQEDLARSFYCDRLGFSEVAKPSELAGRGGVWFAQNGVNLHLGVDGNFQAATKAHPALAVTDLDSSFSALRDITTSEISALPDIKRFYIADPFGNRIEILQEN